MKYRTLICLTFALSLLATSGQSATSDWLAAPKPKFPTNALKNGSEGSVRVRIVLSADGTVKNSVVTKSSGDQALDQAAQEAVLKWKIKPSAIKPSDLAKGRETIVEFKQEALLAAVYPDRRAYFENSEKTDMWMYAPFASYPRHARELHHTGSVLLYVRLGNDGRVAVVRKLKSSGYDELDQAAIAAVRLWRAHKQYAGQEGHVPIDFIMSGRYRY